MIEEPMKIKKIVDINMDQNCYVVYKQDSKRCLVIDPGGTFKKLKTYLTDNELIVSDVLLTHCHYDHISSLNPLIEFSAANLVASDNCYENLKKPGINLSTVFAENFVNETKGREIEDNEVFLAADLSVTPIFTPGHTNCSTCYLIEDCLFTGDTLFHSTVGRWDLPTGKFSDLKKSLQEKIYTLDDDIKVYAGHDGESTIGYEKKFNVSINTNPHIQGLN